MLQLCKIACAFVPLLVCSVDTVRVRIPDVLMWAVTRVLLICAMQSALVKHFETTLSAKTTRINLNLRLKPSIVQSVCYWRAVCALQEMLNCWLVTAKLHYEKSKKPPQSWEACGRSAVVSASDGRGSLTVRVCGSLTMGGLCEQLKVRRCSGVFESSRVMSCSNHLASRLSQEVLFWRVYLQQCHSVQFETGSYPLLTL